MEITPEICDAFEEWAAARWFRWCATPANPILAFDGWRNKEKGVFFVKYEK